MNFKVYGVDASGLPFEQIEEEESRANHLAKQLKDENYSDVIVEEVWSSLDEMNEWIATRPKYFSFEVLGWLKTQAVMDTNEEEAKNLAISIAAGERNMHSWKEVTAEEYRAL